MSVQVAVRHLAIAGRVSGVNYFSHWTRLQVPGTTLAFELTLGADFASLAVTASSTLKLYLFAILIFGFDF